MPVDYQIDASERLIRTRCTGAVSLAEVVAHFRALEADPLLPDQLDVLLDFSELTTFPDSDQVRSVALEVRHLLSKVSWNNCAIVAPRDLAFGIGRMFEMISEPYFHATMVFRRLPEAEQWLRTHAAPAA
jgi:hypothetical protein